MSFLEALDQYTVKIKEVAKKKSFCDSLDSWNEFSMKAPLDSTAIHDSLFVTSSTDGILYIYDMEG